MLSWGIYGDPESVECACETAGMADFHCGVIFILAFLCWLGAGIC